MMPAAVTWGHVLIALAALVALYGIAQALTWMRYSGEGHRRGTPGYARARDGRRYMFWSFAAALVLLAAGALTALRDTPIS